MDQQTATANIGQSFKVIEFKGMRFDTIRSVDENGYIDGDFTVAHCSDCKLKKDQPKQLRKSPSIPLFTVVSPDGLTLVNREHLQELIDCVELVTEKPVGSALIAIHTLRALNYTVTIH